MSPVLSWPHCVNRIAHPCCSRGTCGSTRSPRTFHARVPRSRFSLCCFFLLPPEGAWCGEDAPVDGPDLGLLSLELPGKGTKRNHQDYIWKQNTCTDPDNHMNTIDGLGCQCHLMTSLWWQEILVTTGLGNGLLPVQHQAISWNDDFFSTELLRTNLSKICIKGLYVSEFLQPYQYYSALSL